jgi:hypothetical protein
VPASGTFSVHLLRSGAIIACPEIKYRLVGISVKANTSATESACAAEATLKCRQIIDMAVLISSNARLRPGHNRGPDPNGRSAWRSRAAEALSASQRAG